MNKESDRLAHYKSQPHFVPIAEVEEGQLYWFGVRRTDGSIVQFAGVVVVVNGNKAAMSHTTINWLDDERIFGAFRQSHFNQARGIARMYSYLGNYAKASCIQLAAYAAMTPEQHRSRYEALQRLRVY